MTQPSTEKPTNTLKTGWQGILNLAYADRHKSTEIIHNYSQAPLKVQQPFYPEGKEICHSVILHTAGGVVGGDRLSMNFDLKPNAKAVITTAAASKIYRSNGSEAKQIIDIKVGKNAILEWFPQETIVFNGAIYHQYLRIDLAPEANILLWEITRFGRSARGEKFLSGEWRSHTEIWQQNRPLWIDRQWLQGTETMFNSPYCLAGQPVVATFAWVGEPVTPELVEKVRALWDEHPSRSDPTNEQITFPASTGVTRLTNGLLCRYRGSSTAAARQWFVAIWQLLRLSFWQRPAFLPRVWPP